MTQVQMPEPVVYRKFEYRGGEVFDVEYNSVPHFSFGSGGEPLYTSAQMEAYAAAKVREAQRWHPIDSAPHETLVVLGWYDENGVFKQEIALASAGRRYPGGASDMWWHGRATHWMPLPAPPT